MHRLIINKPNFLYSLPFSMDSLNNLSLFLIVFFTMIISPATSQPCHSYTFPNHVNFAACNDLPVLDSSIHWNYHSSSSTVDIAFKKSSAKESGWIAWAINPTSKGMVGSQAFVAFQKSDGTLAAYTSPITSYGTQLKEGNLSFSVHGVSATYTSTGEMIIFASFQLPGNSTSVNQLWQEGPVSGDTPGMHALSGPNLQSFGSMDFITGQVSETHDSDLGKRIILRKVHGILNGIGWGILMPIGVMMARYLKAFEGEGSTWFHLHRACQILAYFTGVAGVAIGIYIGNHSAVHGYIGIAIFSLATAQILAAVFFRPKPLQKSRISWNIFHYIVGYGVIALAIMNMFRGFAISNSYKKWKTAYIGIIVSLGCIALILEVITWFLVCKKKKNKDSESERNSQNPVAQEKEEVSQEVP